MLDTGFSFEHSKTTSDESAVSIRFSGRQEVSYWARQVRWFSGHEGTSASSAYLFSKRFFDILLSTTGLLVLLPLLLVVGLAIRLESKGPALFRQARWGKGGRKIMIFKFRSMRMDQCDRSGTRQTVRGDARITRLGAFLRKTSIDELPQLINVLKGEMSLVGPRCHPIGMKAGGMLFEELVPEYHLRHTVTPGLTGLAQVRGFRGPTLDAELAYARVASDLEYVATRNLWTDLSIVLQTVLKELRGGSGF